MLDGAFFSKKSHPSRLMVNALAHAGIGWSPTMGHDDPLYRKIETIVHQYLRGRCIAPLHHHDISQGREQLTQPCPSARRKETGSKAEPVSVPLMLKVPLNVAFGCSLT